MRMNNRRSKVIRSATAVAAAIGLTARSLAGTPAVLVDDQLQPHRVVLQGLAQGKISYFGPARELRIDPVDRFVQMRFDAAEPSAEPAELTEHENGDGQPGVLELTDGQRLTGRWVGCDPGSQQVRWRHATLGDIALGLDKIKAMGLSTHTPRGDDTITADRIELANGDRLVGVLTGVGERGVTFEPEGVGQPVELPMGQVVAMRLANPADRKINDQPMVGFADGSRVLVESVEVTADHVLIYPLLHSGRAPVTVPVARVERIDLSTRGVGLMDLADEQYEVLDGGWVFGLPVGPRVEKEGLWLHAPTKIQHELPPGATRLAATVELDLSGSDPFTRGWADLEVVVENGGRAVFRARLSSREPVAQINVPLTGPTLTIVVEEGHNGPVRDRLRVRDAIVLVGRAGQ